MINLEKSSDFYVDIPESIIVSNQQFFNEIKQYDKYAAWTCSRVYTGYSWCGGL